MYYEVLIINIGAADLVETIARPISSQTEPIYDMKLLISSRWHECTESCKNTSSKQLYYKLVYSKRKIKLKILTEYLCEKITHCRKTIKPDTFISCDCICNRGGGQKSYPEKKQFMYNVYIKCNLEWLISVIETEIDYHLGKKTCTKKCNEMYMREYVATQLSGFGEKFYHPENNISNSIIAGLYK